MYNSSVKRYTVPSSVKIIKTDSFSGSVINDLIIPDTVETLSKKAVAKYFVLQPLKLLKFKN